MELPSHQASSIPLPYSPAGLPKSCGHVFEIELQSHLEDV